MPERKREKGKMEGVEGRWRERVQNRDGEESGS